ncbi:synaptic plasticity regulator PANTS-like [Babylonia areolata]|uniref:synaptic plasticity regulator PANTS-like n=1 Tax=Babylonia areolata TaxID=304850 RepID=UPI003FD4A181
MAAPKEKRMTTSSPEDTPEDLWMLRPCEIYLEEFSDCSSVKGRFHQYYTGGCYDDCERWQQDYKQCLKFRKTGDVSAAESIIEHEKERRAARLEAARGNDVWEYRSTPPADWNAPMKDWVKERKDTVLARVQAQKESTGTMSAPDSARCVVS